MVYLWIFLFFLGGLLVFSFFKYYLLVSVICRVSFLVGVGVKKMFVFKLMVVVVDIGIC